MLKENDLSGLRLIFYMVIPFLLGGCVAALPVVTAVSMAATAGLGFKFVQLETGGSIEISFDDEELINQEEIRSVRKPAVWTGE
uniref:Uncharacterized protein n=1 Tax=Candidatus Kentrum sp. TUN TaxID=2126343 RepID=A0A450ZZ02_9GAMM|nr:MAG: hypothetical protein BECKTUN1418D_GA0071000_10948 [Candidatus Kentron sp. TUN]